MTDIDRTIIEGVIVCPASAAKCRCTLPDAHDGPHRCDPVSCGGVWLGEVDTDSFVPLNFPGLGGIS